MTCADATGTPITITGRYITITDEDSVGRMKIAEIYAWNNQELAHAVTSASTSGFSVSTGSWTDVFGNSASTNCMDFSVSSHPPSLSFDLPETGQVSDVLIYGGSFTSFDAVTASV